MSSNRTKHFFLTLDVMDSLNNMIAILADIKMLPYMYANKFAIFRMFGILDTFGNFREYTCFKTFPIL